MDGEEWQGLTVRTCDGSAVGVVMGVFEDGPLAGRHRRFRYPTPRGGAPAAG